jgi:dihydroflavonol-4-reductase
MAHAFVTGGTGFVGVNLIRTLLERGWEVTAIHRQNSDLKYLSRTGARLVVADIVDRAAVQAAMPHGIDTVFHVAGDTSMWKYANATQTRNNVEGTRNLVQAALTRGARRYVQTSSTAAFGLHRGTRIDETTRSNAVDAPINYLRSKWLADEQVRAGIERGLDAVLLHPANILGPFDTKGWARLFILLSQGRVPGAPPGSGPWCHVRDIVAAHLSAAERGRTGHGYLLGGPVASFADVVGKAAALLGVPPPRRVPPAVLFTLGRIGEWSSFFRRHPPDVTPEIARLLTASEDCDSSKAERELGYSTCSVDEMVGDTHAWLASERLV